MFRALLTSVFSLRATSPPEIQLLISVYMNVLHVCLICLRSGARVLEVFCLKVFKSNKRFILYNPFYSPRIGQIPTLGRAYFFSVSMWLTCVKVLKDQKPI